MGEIYVDSPEVFARERLVRDRQEQEAWLRSQLSKVDAAEFGNQGVLQFRSLSQQSATLGLDATPGAGVSIAQGKAALDDLRRQQEIAQIEHRLRIAELEQQLAAAGDGEPVTAASSASETDSASDAGGGTKPPSADPLALLVGGHPHLPPGVSGAEVSPRSLFRDRLALREEIRHEIFEVILDDSHDLGGNTLYQLKFDTTVVPHANTSGWAKVEVTVTPGLTDCGTPGGKLSEQCRVPLTELFHGAAEEVLKRSVLKYMSASALLEDMDPIPRNRVLQRYRMAVSASGSEPDESLGNEIDCLQKKKKQGDGDSPSTSDEGPDERKAPDARGGSEAQRDSGDESQPSHRDLVAIVAAAFRPEETPFRVTVDDVSECHICVSSNPRPALGDNDSLCADVTDEALKFASLGPGSLAVSDEALLQLHSLTDRQRPVSAYAVTPKEAVARLSLSDASRDARQAALAVGAAAGAANLDAALERATLLEASAHAIERTPLVVGYSHSDGNRESTYRESSRFGWILGPTLKWRTGKDASGFDLRHVTRQESLTAIVSVPAWWTSAKLDVTTRWLRERDLTELADKPEKGSQGANEDRPSRNYEILLPGDPAAVVNTLLPASREPSGYIWSSPYPRLQVGRKGVFTIQGSNVWRSPMVMVGDQLADKVEPLPNMAGLLVTLDAVQTPPGGKPTDPAEVVQVFLWTSDTPVGGIVVGSVEIVWPHETPKTPTVAAGFSVETDSSHLVVKDGNAKVALDFVLPKAPPLAAVDEVFIEVVSAQLLLSESTGPCLDSHVSKVTETCRVELALASLIANTKVIIKTYRKIGQQKLWHAPIELDVVAP